MLTSPPAACFRLLFSLFFLFSLLSGRPAEFGRMGAILSWVGAMTEKALLLDITTQESFGRWDPQHPSCLAEWDGLM